MLRFLRAQPVVAETAGGPTDETTARGRLVALQTQRNEYAARIGRIEQQRAETQATITRPAALARALDEWLDAADQTGQLPDTDEAARRGREIADAKHAVRRAESALRTLDRESETLRPGYLHLCEQVDAAVSEVLVEIARELEARRREAVQVSLNYEAAIMALAAGAISTPAAHRRFGIAAARAKALMLADRTEKRAIELAAYSFAQPWETLRERLEANASATVEIGE